MITRAATVYTHAISQDVTYSDKNTRATLGLSALDTLETFLADKRSPSREELHKYYAFGSFA